MGVLYDIPDDFTETLQIRAGMCLRCGGEVMVQGFDVPCCGGGFTCSDSNTQYVCIPCKSFRFDW